MYELEILESQRGTELFYIDVTSGGRSVTAASSKARRCDVAITVTSADLAAVLSGASSPLQVGPSNISRIVKYFSMIYFSGLPHREDHRQRRCPEADVL